MQRLGRQTQLAWVAMASLVAVGLSLGCDPENQPQDSGVFDAGAPVDAGPDDAGQADAGDLDSGVEDSGVSADAGFDAGPADDAGVADAGRADGGTPDSGVSDSGVPDAGVTPFDAGVARDRLMYVTLQGDNRLGVVTLNANGTMTARPTFDLTLPGAPGAMVYARAAQRLFVAYKLPADTNPQGQLATVSLNAQGRPTLVGSTPNIGAGVSLGLARNGRYLVSAQFFGNRVRSFDVMGAPPHAAKDDVGTLVQPHCALVARNDTRVYVPHRDGEAVRWFAIDAMGGLTLEDTLESGGSATNILGPRHATQSADGNYLYVTYEGGDEVAVHTVAANGALTRVQRISTRSSGLPANTNNVAELKLTPDGRFLYASNRGDNTLAMYSVGSNGRLTWLGQIATETIPRAFEISPDGRYVVVAGQSSGFLQSFRVQSNGMLQSVDRLSVGQTPLWVSID